MKNATQQGSAASPHLAGEFLSAALSRKTWGFVHQAGPGKAIRAPGRIPQSLLLLRSSAMMIRIRGVLSPNPQSWNLNSWCITLFSYSCHQRLLSCSHSYRADLNCDIYFSLPFPLLKTESQRQQCFILNRTFFFTLEYFLKLKLSARMEHIRRHTSIVNETEKTPWT